MGERSLMYSSLEDMLKKKGSVNKGGRQESQHKHSEPLTINNQEGLIAYYNSLNRNERIIYRSYYTDHAYHLDYRALDNSYFGSFDETIAYIEGYQQLGPAVTVFYEHQHAACFGFAQLVPGVFEAWCMGSKLFDKHPVAATRTAKFVIDQGAKFLAAHRMQVTVRAENKVANNWASVLQFKLEGCMKQFGHDKTDYMLYGKIY